MATPASIIVGAVIGAAGSISAANAEKKAAQQNAALARMQAQEDARRAKRQSDALIGQQRAVTGASGTTIEGSPLLIVQDSAREAEIEIRHILAGGAARARAYQQAGRAAAQTGFIDAGSTLLSGVGRALSIP